MSLTLESSHNCYTPWSVFQDGSYKAIFTRSLRSPSVKRSVAAKGSASRTAKCVYAEKVTDLAFYQKNAQKERGTYSSPEVTKASSNQPKVLVSRQIILFIRFLLNDFKSFHPLFKVLFIFPSQYLYAIGFPSIFSLRRSLAPV